VTAETLSPSSPPAGLQGVSGGPPALHLNALYLAAVTGALIAGIAAWAGSAGEAADLVWAAGAVLGLLLVSLSIARSLVRREVGVDIIALVALIGALALHEYLAGAVISVMLASGRTLEDYAAARSRRALTALLQHAPRVAYCKRNGAIEAVPIENVRPADILVVKPGEVVPVDGLLVQNAASLDESVLTGESRIVERPPGEQVSSGTVNAGPPFEMRAIATAERSTYAGIIRLVREAQESKAPSSRLADRYALVFVPVTLSVAGAAWWLSGDAVRALAVVVVATPCPLILAVPVAIVSGISRAARRGVIVKGGAVLETLATARILLFDKTGTLTEGHPVVADIVEAEGGASELFRIAASLEQVSLHVHASAIVREARRRGVVLSLPSDVAEETGLGIHGKVDGRRVAIGRLEWVCPGSAPPEWVRKLKRRMVFDGQASVFVSIDGVLAGAILLEDPIRPDTPRTLRALRRAGIARLVMVTGDRADVAESVGAVAGVDQVLAERSPSEKVDAVKGQRVHGTTIMVGDGINDAPALAAADVGVAMGARGATASSAAADVVLVVDRLDRLAEVLRISRRARRIALQSVLAGMGLSGIAMGFAAAGYLAPVAGAVLQEGIDVAVILNALRALGGYAAAAPVKGPMPKLADRFRAEHVELLPRVDQLRSLADRMDSLDRAAALQELKNIHRFLAVEILPHEEAEEKEFYPTVARVIGGEDPTGTMSRGHVEIAHLTRLLGRLVDDIGTAGPDESDIADARRILYGLHAVLRLHFAQEEEAYLSLVEPGATGPA
jgi:heavy metal translocating P-type ATPase